ncbi:hypothetical protein GCM10010510_49240 [Streptomyces anandii JCM 4720]|nr:hypothetical protein GCM10010510_49240 [Streptomyces anandii JCM 4720]
MVVVAGGVERRLAALELAANGVPVREVARRVGVSVQTVYRWRRLGVQGRAGDAAGGRVAVLERELTLCRRVIEEMRAAMPPKDGTR